MEPTPKQRTSRQNKALHKWFKESADLLNSHGANMQVVLNKRHEIWWSEDSFKAALFKEFIRKVYKKGSTTELTTRELTEAVEMIKDVIARDSGVVLPEFPSVEALMLQEQLKK